MSEEKFHVLRAKLPWRPDEELLTECGRKPGGLDVLTREEARARAKEWGERRTYLAICMTCHDTLERWWPTWEESPTTVMQRAVRGRDEQINQELRAIGMLIEAHAHEFSELLGALGETDDLAGARSKRRFRQSYGR